MRVVSWNINSIRARLDTVLDWMEANEPDVVCLQETKVNDQEFPEDEFGDLDYDAVVFGKGAYNGVAILSRTDPEQVVRGLPGDDDDAQRRVIAATVDGVRFVDVYCPNGQAIGAEQFDFKLDWFARLHAYLDGAHAPDTPLVICGDFNITPSDEDAHRPLEGGLFGSERERAALAKLTDWGLTDTFRHLYPERRAFTWWDYRSAGFTRDAGLRIDHFLVTAPLVPRVKEVRIDLEARAQPKASDHAPVILELG